MNNRIKGVIFDWAGTTVDYGCFAPVNVFIEVFRKRGVHITLEEAREPMGLLKIDHIRAICQMDRVTKEWEGLHGEEPSEVDVRALYEDFEPMMFRVLENYAEPIPHVLEAVEDIRNKGIKIGSTTGYTKEMVEVVAREAKKKGYAPDSIVASTEVSSGRPLPWMCYANAMNLGVYPMQQMMKVGDTTSDMAEGLNAGMLTVGVVKGSSTLGLTKDQVDAMENTELNARIEKAKRVLTEAGAHYVIEDMSELPGLIDEINQAQESEVAHV
ncbi:MULTISPECIES: phosphonoacetaldehyde hydrolase [Pontibacillus]|uniref:Phosphonoacetaldehyde hydrolase n=1 Tax=Pontibacillus chungwhensis TaxID=265426 RepID=A0ABY8UXB1_9BACI|nr:MULTISPECIES: phosphonoacetaldehyde hydrolase [Pontibacillus]MCD5325777.1 phosphonoacetaldehyde hydrolase [Pontibacillus sp. HN14]WIF98310.1 phosphonoacetaldehyde hydrolase [Pontibacillus chungwhensis]